MITLGIDPGTRRIGYGLVRAEGSVLHFLAAGILTIKSREDLGALRETKQGVDALIRKWKPGVLAIEKLYFAKNKKTGLAVAHARGVIALSGLERGLEIREYAPNEVKANLTGYGFADKKAVLKMARLILCEPRLKIIDDASDALGIAIVASRAQNRA